MESDGFVRRSDLRDEMLPSRPAALPVCEKVTPAMCRSCGRMNGHGKKCRLRKPDKSFPSMSEEEKDRFVESMRDRKCEICRVSFRATALNHWICTLACKEKRRELNRIHGNVNRLKSFGMTIEDYDELVRSQGGLCKICKKPETKINPFTGKAVNLSIDHDHSTGKVRGLLCGFCNWGLGNFKDNPELLQAALDYLANQRPDKTAGLT